MNPILGRAFLCMVVLSAMLCFMGCATFGERLEGRIASGRHEDAIKQGERWLERHAHKPKKAEETVGIRRLVCKAHLERAKSIDTVAAYRAFQGRFLGNTLYTDMLEEGRVRESWAFLRDEARPSGNPQRYREFRKLYSGTPDEPAVRQEEVLLAYQVEVVGKGTDAMTRFRQQYEDWPEAADLLREVRRAEAESAYQDARRVDTIEGLHAYLERYGRWVEAAAFTGMTRTRILELELVRLRNDPRIDHCRTMVRKYAPWQEARGFIDQVRRIEAAIVWQDVQASGSWQRLRQYVEAYPDAPNRLEAERIARDLWGFEGPIGPGELLARVNLTDDRASPRIDLLVQVEDAKGTIVGGLPESAFEIYENGRRVPLVGFRGMDDSQAVDIVFVLDTTGSMNNEIGGVKSGAIRFAESLRLRNRDARLGLVAFGDEVRAVFPRRGGLTANVDEFQRWIAEQEAKGGDDTPENALDAIKAALAMPFRKDAHVILVLITDAPMHEVNRITRESVAGMAGRIRARMASFFCIGPDVPQIRDLVSGSSGRFFLLSRRGDFDEVLGLISTLSAKQYRLSYRSEVPMGIGLRHRVRVYSDHEWVRMQRMDWAGITSLTMHPGNSNVAFVFQERGDLFRTADGGATWEPVKVSLEQRDIRTMVAGASPDAGLLMVTLDGLGFRSQDGGRTWTPDADGPAGILAVLQDMRDPDTLLATDGQVFLASDDFGGHWKPLGALPTPAASVQLLRHPLDSSVLWAVTPESFWESRDAGLSWTDAPVQSPVEGVSPSECRYFTHPNWTGLLFAITPEGAIARSVDAGLNWNIVLAVVPGESAPDKILSMSFDPTVRHWILANTHRQALVSRDDGVTWKVLSRIGDERDGAHPLVSIGSDGRILMARRGAGAVFALNPVVDKEFVSGSIYFATNSANVSPSLLPYLDQLAQVLQRNAQALVRVEGHTDDVGSEDYNMKLSLARAENIRSHLMSRGVPSARILAEGYGKGQPIVANTSAKNRARNRRVELSILGQHEPLPSYRAVRRVSF